MPFLNPFKKNNRSESVKLAGMTSDADPRDAASSTAGERREPSFGGAGNLAEGFSKGAGNTSEESTFESTLEPTLTPAFKAASNPAFESVKPESVLSTTPGGSVSSEVPPAFTFSEPKVPSQPQSWGSVAPKLQDSPALGSSKSAPSTGSSSSSFAPTSAPATATWDPYGMGTPVKQSAAENPFSAVSPSPVDVGRVAPEIPKEPVLPQVANETTAGGLSSGPVVKEPTVGAPISPLAEDGAPAATPESAVVTPTAPMEPVIAPMERPAKTQAPQGRREQSERTPTAQEQAPSTTKSLFKKFGRSTASARSLSPAEREARMRSRHRYVGAAALLMALVVAAPFMLDKSEEIDNRPFADERMDIPHETETSTTINPVPIDKKPISGDVDVADMTLGKSSSTAKANLAREADLPTKPSRLVKPATEKTTAPPKKEAVAANAQKTEAPVKTAGITPPMGAGWYVQVLATGSEEGAERVVRRMTALGLSAYRIKEGGNLWKVRAGLYSTKKEAENAQATIILNNVAQKPYVRKQ